jgi:hypothetical protein
MYILFGDIGDKAQGLYLHIRLISDQETHHTAKTSNLKQRADEFSASFRKVSCVANAADPYGRNLGSGPGPLFFLSSSSSIVLTRLSGPSSRPTTSEKMW